MLTEASNIYPDEEIESIPMMNLKLEDHQPMLPHQPLPLPYHNVNDLPKSPDKGPADSSSLHPKLRKSCYVQMDEDRISSSTEGVGPVPPEGMGLVICCC